MDKRVSALIPLLVVAAACGSSGDATSDVVVTLAEVPDDTVAEPTADTVAVVAPADTSAVDDSVVDGGDVADDVDVAAGSDESDGSGTSGEVVALTAEVWADNWFALYVNGELVGEDSVPITTERSFNAETISFEATLPITMAIEAKDFKETDSGIEYIGANNQQMGDGGIIVQVSNSTTGEVVAVSSGDWSALPIHRAPLNTECERDADPDATCEFEIVDAPADWAAVGFDDSSWASATEWSEADVSPKDGYDQISWDPSARLIWGTDLEVDNTVLLRTTVS